MKLLAMALGAADVALDVVCVLATVSAPWSNQNPLHVDSWWNDERKESETSYPNIGLWAADRISLGLALSAAIRTQVLKRQP